MNIMKASQFFSSSTLFCLSLLICSRVVAAETPSQESPPCEPVKTVVPNPMRSETYKGMPFQPGEEARYILKYGLVRVHVGYGFLRVEPPVKQQINTFSKEGQIQEESRWHRVLSAEAYTGEWYKLVFAAHDRLQSMSRPWDFSVSKFYISQNEEKPFVRRYNAEKWLSFDHANCKVQERSVDHKKNKEKTEEHFVNPGAVDAMAAAYKLRTFNYVLNKTERFMVYTSGQNWWLEATPTALETLETPIGTHKAYKLALKSYLGKELQQRGKLFVWIAADHPQKVMLKIEGEVTFGSIYLEIDRFTPGVALDAPVSAPSSAAPVPTEAPQSP